MLIGGSNHVIDAKGRVFFPVRFKEDMWDDIVVCRGVDKCLMLFAPEGWKTFSDMIKAQPFTTATRMQQFFFSTAARCSVDQQGRLLLPQQLRGFAGLEKEVWIVGTQERVEIWDVGEWNKHQAEIESGEIRGYLDNMRPV